MASSISTAAAFTTTNMKPASGEQIDSLWGQNIADNSGFNFYKEVPLPCFSEDGFANLRTFMFTKRASHNGIKWVGRGQQGTSGNQTVHFWVWDSTGTVAHSGASPLIVGTHTDAMTSGGIIRHDFDISSLGAGTVYTFGVSDSGPLVYSPQAAWLTYGSGATY